MPKFKIVYWDSDGVEQVDEETFEDSDDCSITALEWAHDYAYTAADKGPYVIEEIS